MSESKQSLLKKLAERFGIADGNKLLDTLKKTAFSSGNRAPSNEEMMALLIVADQHGLNPFTREIYAFPDKKGGIIPVVGIDGWTRIANEHKQYDGYDLKYSETMVTMDDHTKPCHEYIEVTIFRRDRKHPTVIREYLDEVYRPPIQKTGNRGPYVIPTSWQSHPKRFLRHKGMIQAYRMAFGFGGIYEPDEAERIREQQEIDMGTVEVVEETPKQTPQPVVSQQQQPVIEHQTQPDLMGQIAGNQMQESEPVYEQTVVVEAEPVSVQQHSVQADHGFVQQEEQSMAQSPGFMPRPELVGHAKNLVDQTRTYKSWETSFQYAKDTWKGDEQAYVLSELTKAHQAACQTH